MRISVAATAQLPLNPRSTRSYTRRQVSIRESGRRKGGRLEFRVLGPLEVVHDGQKLALGKAQQQAVIGLLALCAPQPVPIDRLVDEVWGERPPASAHHAIQVYVSAIRKLLRSAGAEATVTTSAAGYALEVDPERVDANRFERLVSAAQSAVGDHPASAREQFREALALWRGQPLAGLGWERERPGAARPGGETARLDELRTSATEGLAEAELALGRHREVVGAISELVAANPLREQPRRLLMLALYRSGRHAEALTAYREARAALDEIGLQPGPDLRALEQAILRHDPALLAAEAEAEAVPDPGGRSFELDEDSLRSGDPPRAPLRSPPSLSALPAAPHPLVGRRSEMERIRALLARSDVRLVTLLGPGGSGKTRLALEVATEQSMRYRDGARFVSLAALTDPTLVASEIARAVDVKEAEGQPMLLALSRALARRQMLLVIDNFEHLIGAAEVVSHLLAAAPGLDVLVTSREPLRIGGEHRLEITPLPAGRRG